MIFTIGDLHLPLGIDKSMDIFGSRWENYVERLRENWQFAVGENDTVIIPGDFSWATYLEESKKDFDFLESLNGKKIILKGNHDYWWTTMTKLNEFMEENGYKSISFLHNNSFTVEGVSICGTRGWLYPGFTAYTAEDEKYYVREVGRLQYSLELAKTDEKFVFMHYPPTSKLGEENGFIEVMKRYGVEKCFYGHLHGASHNNRVPEEIDGIKFRLVASDYLEFRPLVIKGESL